MCVCVCILVPCRCKISTNRWAVLVGFASMANSLQKEPLFGDNWPMWTEIKQLCSPHGHDPGIKSNGTKKQAGAGCNTEKQSIPLWKAKERTLVAENVAEAYFFLNFWSLLLFFNCARLWPLLKELRAKWDNIIRSKMIFGLWTNRSLLHCLDPCLPCILSMCLLDTPSSRLKDPTTGYTEIHRAAIQHI